MVKNFTSNKQTGKYGENLAKNYLEKAGFKILELNYRFSRQSEIDIIAAKNNVLHFVEVKTRFGTKFGSPVEAVTQKKIASIFQCVKFYIQQNKIKYNKLQIDAIGIVLFDDKEPAFTFIEDISL